MLGTRLQTEAKLSSYHSPSKMSDIKTSSNHVDQSTYISSEIPTRYNQGNRSNKKEVKDAYEDAKRMK